MKTKYYIADPSGNITALVITAFDRNAKSVAKKIMSKNNSIEQVGFVDFADGNIKLRMSGNEFCGNATMSAAALYYKLTKKQGRYETAVSVLGNESPVKVAVAKKHGYYDCECELDWPVKIETIEFEAQNNKYKYPIVHFEGISHIIADENLGEDAAQNVIKRIAREHSLKALGIMLLSSNKLYMKPLVYVTGVNTLFFENSCASGTCAVSAVYGSEKGISLSQPGGVISAINSDKIRLFGKVKLSKCYSEEI